MKGLLFALSGIVLVALLIVGGIALSTYIDNRQIADARTSAVDSASEKVVAMLGYDYETAESSLPTAAEGLTGDFREEYLKLIQDSIIPGAKEKQLTVKVSVQGAAVISATPDTVDVLIFLNQVTTNIDNPQAVTTGSRLRVSMQHVDGEWLISQLAPI
ncbi:h domain protein [Antrihabitans sp. YC2-6]|uniref:h domain protein n=1 Tax=Antrihabitans sp. YC2-6 TaxID=2799498 RepID=UPI0018F2A935|nr:h domain protein [Antrihabitans sp. YC2-6]MBJ8345758.1 h domain protein [Antrihabitans sp. YC2-6]